MRYLLSVLLLVLSLQASAQLAQINGKIVTSSNQPLTSATLEITGSNLGTTTDEMGDFVLKNIPSGNQTLKISYVGYKSQYLNINLASGDSINLGSITLQQSQEQLGIVSINGKKHNKFKRETSVSVSKMPLADIENPQVYTSIT